MKLYSEIYSDILGKKCHIVICMGNSNCPDLYKVWSRGWSEKNITSIYHVLKFFCFHRKFWNSMSVIFDCYCGLLSTFISEDLHRAWSYHFLLFKSSRQLPFDRCSCSQHKYWAFYNQSSTEQLSTCRLTIQVSLRMPNSVIIQTHVPDRTTRKDLPNNWRLNQQLFTFYKFFYEISTKRSACLHVFLASLPLLLIFQFYKQLINNPLFVTYCTYSSVSSLSIFTYFTDLCTSLWCCMNKYILINYTCDFIWLCFFNRVFVNIYWREVRISVW